MLNRADVLFLSALALDAGKKIHRDAFLYLDNRTDKQFAQCGTCYAFAEDEKRCSILGSHVEIAAEDTCGFYLKGTYQGQPIEQLVSPQEAGLVKGTQVRCENCHYGGDECKLYVELNAKLPDVFDLDTRISSLGCCNAWVS